MSRENVEVVRLPIAVKTTSHRQLEERFLLRFPRLLALLARAVSQLRPRSRLRRASVRRAFQVGFQAQNRRDYDAAFALYRPDCESLFPPQLVSVGFEPVYRGRKARIEAQKRWDSEWSDWRVEPYELIDLGDRTLVMGRLQGSGLSSGAVVGEEVAFLYTVLAGQAVREQFFFNHTEALKAAGLSE